MTTWRLWAHSEVEESIRSLDPVTGESIRRKVEWAQVQLACQGETTIMKGVQGHNVHWRRTPVKGNEYYLWWAKGGTKGFEALPHEPGSHDIFVRKIRQHDLTSAPLDPGTWEDYSPVDISSLDPRFQEQREVLPKAYSLLCVKTVNGYPGSGKTIALLYAARDLITYGHILYVTYTERLAREARDFFQTIALAESVSVLTLAELETDILGNSHGAEELTSSATAYRRFVAFVDQTFARKHRWLRGAELALWEQVRAYLFGMALPFDWRRGGVQIPKCDCLSSDLYTRIFGDWDGKHLELLYRLAEQAQEQGLCTEQTRAREALNVLLDGNLPTAPHWMSGLRGLVIDEIQDLTPLQIALLAEVARFAYERIPDHSHRCFAFIAAGDESQIVQPSGFEWTIAKDLLHDRLNATPDPIEFQQQRRSPRRLAQLLNNTWSLYMDGRRRREQPQALPDDAEEGKVLRCRLEGACDWSGLLQALAKSPGRAIIDLDGTFKTLVSGADGVEGPIRACVYTPQDIKGLDRRTVLVWHLGKTIAKHSQLAEAGGFPGLQARHVIGSVRVALSRPTETLVILEHNDTEDLSILDLKQIGAHLVDFDGLLRYLEQEEFSSEERLEGFLREADEALGRDDLDRATELNKRAQDLCHFVDDPQLTTRATEQHRTIRGRRIELILQEAARQVERGNVHLALSANQRAEHALEATDTPSLRDAVRLQRRDIVEYPVHKAFQEANSHREHGNFEKALAANARASEAARKITDASLINEVRYQRSAIRSEFIDSLLQEADAQLAHGDLESALASNQCAKDLIEPSDAQYLKKKIRDQREKLKWNRVELLIREADTCLGQGMTGAARDINERAANLCARVSDPGLTAAISAQKIRITLAEHLTEAKGYRAKGDSLATYQVYRAINALASKQGLTPKEISMFEANIRSIWRWLEPQLEQLARNSMQEGIRCIKSADWIHAANALQIAANIRADQDKPEFAEALQCLVDRYAHFTPPLEPKDGRMELLVSLIGRYLNALQATRTGTDTTARRFAEQWLQEALPAVDEQPELLPEWLVYAKRVADWSKKDIASLFGEMSRYVKPALIRLRGTSVDPRALTESLEMAGEGVPPALRERCELMDYAEKLLELN